MSWSCGAATELTNTTIECLGVDGVFTVGSLKDRAKGLQVKYALVRASDCGQEHAELVGRVAVERIVRVSVLDKRAQVVSG